MSKSSSRRKRQEQKKKQEARLTGPVLAQQGLQAFKQGDYRAAIQAWEKARHKADKPAKLIEALAEAYFRQGVSASPPGLADLAQAVQLRPADPMYRYHLALAHHRLGQLNEAESIYRELLAAEPPFERAAAPLAQLLIEQKTPLSKDSVGSHLEPKVQAQLAAAEALVRGKVVSTLQRLAEETPLEPVWQGLLALALGNKAAARQHLPAALSTSPSLSLSAQAVAHYYLGVLAAEAGQLEAAYQHWHTAQTNGLDTPHLRQNLSALAYRQAVAAQQAGRPQEARERLGRISAHPGFSPADLTRQVNWELGYAAALQSQWEQALAHWQAVAQAGDDSRHLLLNLALAYQKTGHFFEAAERWRELLRRRPRKADHPDALNDEQVARIWQNVAENYNAAGYYDEAITTYKNALKWSPDNLNLRLKLVEAQQAAGRWQAAENELNRILEQHPNHVPALVMLAESYSEDYFSGPARQLWAKVLELEPQHPVARQQLAHLYEREGSMAAQWGNTKRAREVYQEGLGQFPDNQRLHLVMGLSYARDRDFDQARRYFEIALALDPTELNALHDIFLVWVNLGVEPDLEQIINRIKAVQSPIPAGFFIDLIGHSREAKRNAVAESLLEHAEARYAEDEAALLDVAMERLEMGQDEHAATLLRRILKNKPDYAPANLRLGAIYYKMGQTRLANRHWDKVQQQAQKEGDHELLHELKIVKDVLVYGKLPPRSPLEMLSSMPPQLRQQMIDQLPPEIAAALRNGDPDILEAILDLAMGDDFDEEDDDGFF